MNRFSPGDVREVEPGTRPGPLRSATAVVHALLASSSSNPLGLDEWLGEIVKALGGRLAALVAFVDHGPVVQSLFPRDSGFLSAVHWPWAQEWPSVHEFQKPTPAVATASTDGHSSFLTVAVQHEAILWILCLEDANHRTWSEDDRAALTLAALGVFQFGCTIEGSQRWAQWSEKVETQHRLDHAAVIVGRLVHDFNNVLTSVLGFTELSLAQLPPGSAQRNFMAEAYAAAQQGTQMINQLGPFFIRKTATQGQTTPLSLLLSQEGNRLRKSLGDAIRLEIRVGADLPVLSIEADPFRVVLDKLLENAREAITTTGTVIISACQVELTREDCLGLLGKTSPGSYVEITVADTGRGFSAEARRRVFAEPLFSTKPRHRGVGFAAVYGILSNYSGGIRLEHGLEGGTAVRVYVPTPGRAAEALSPGRPAEGRGRRTEAERVAG